MTAEVNTVDKLTEQELRIILHQTATQLGQSYSSIQHLMVNVLIHTKVCVRQVPHASSEHMKIAEPSGLSRVGTEKDGPAVRQMSWSTW